MKFIQYNKNTILLLAISFGITLGSMFFLWYISAQYSECFPIKDGINYIDSSCVHFYDNYKKNILPIFISFFSLFAVALVLLFARQESFDVWRKNAIIAFPLMFIFIWYFSHTANNATFGPSDDVYIYILAPLFVIISYLIIGIKSWKLRGK
ncbi:MAG: hypothetical protein WC878_00275 [Candidatus Paceibacterota bacterium]|jgi:hypothetical protein